MSASWVWTPADPAPGGSIDVRLRSALADQYCNGDETALDGLILGDSVTPWLQGVTAGRARDDELASAAYELLHAINEHRRIRLVRE